MIFIQSSPRGFEMQSWSHSQYDLERAFSTRGWMAREKQPASGRNMQLQSSPQMVGWRCWGSRGSTSASCVWAAAVLMEGVTHAHTEPGSGDDVTLPKRSTVYKCRGAGCTGTAAPTPACPGRVNLGARKRILRSCVTDESDHPAVARKMQAPEMRWRRSWPLLAGSWPTSECPSSATTRSG